MTSFQLPSNFFTLNGGQDFTLSKRSGIFNHRSLGHLGSERGTGSEKVSCGWKDGKMDGAWRQAADGICEENWKSFGENPLALSS